jgi:hypothetical protein
MDTVEENKYIFNNERMHRRKKETRTSSVAIVLDTKEGQAFYWIVL